MLGQVVDVIEEGTALHSSYGQDGYCEEVFLTTVQNFAHSVKKISNNLDEMAKAFGAAHYLHHLYGTQANLCVEHCCQFFTTLQELYNFVIMSTTHFVKLEEKIEELQEGL